MHPGSVQLGFSQAARTSKVLSHCERESLILNEDLTCRLWPASSASRKDTRPDSPSTDGIKLALPVGTFIYKTVQSRS